MFRRGNVNDARQFRWISGLEDVVTNGEVRFAQRCALREGRVDDALSLTEVTAIPLASLTEDLELSYVRLVATGAMGAVERLQERTGFEINLPEDAVRSGYTSLVACGRLEAIDYLQQLSGVPPQFDERVVRLGFACLLVSGRLRALGRLSELTGIRPNFSDSEFGEAAAAAVSRLDFAGLVALVRVSGHEFRFGSDEALRHLTALVDAEVFEEVQGLCELSPPDIIARADEQLQRRLLASGHGGCLWLLFTAQGCRWVQQEGAESAYKIGREQRDSRLVMAVCRATSRRVAAPERDDLLSAALDEKALEPVEFLLEEGAEPRRCGALQRQAFLERLGPSLTRLERKSLALRLDVEDDPETSRILSDFERGSDRPVAAAFRARAADCMEYLHLAETSEYPGESEVDDLRAPIYLGTRRFLGVKDLVVSFRAQRCERRCSFCGLRDSSPAEPVPEEDLKAQVDALLNKYRDDLESIEQLSAGNEGSILDGRRFPRGALGYLLRQSAALTRLHTLSLETRPEYVSAATIAHIRSLAHAQLLDFTVGFETQDDWIRNEVLHKSLSRQAFERVVCVVGQSAARLTVYVLLKPAPGMTDEEGEEEARATMLYLRTLARRWNTEVVVYLNPTYGVVNQLSQDFWRGFTPPTIQSVMETLVVGLEAGLQMYVGLWSEGADDSRLDYTTRDNYDRNIRAAILRYNKTGRSDLLLQEYASLETRRERSTTRGGDAASV